MTRFQLRLRCTACGHRYRRVIEALDEDTLAYMPDPPCPICAAVQRNIGMDVGGGKAPAVGGSLAVRAVDTTAQIVMEDHGLTDLRSDVREGESAAPKLPPRQQAMADGFFGGAHRRRGIDAGILGLPPRQVLKAAVGGRFMTGDTVVPMASQRQDDRPPVHVVAAAGAGGKILKPR